MVLGASMAGLLAARVVADRYEWVTLVERDRLPIAGENRTGVPQGRHVHALLGSGRQVLEEFFPGLTEQVVALGGQAGDLGEQGQWILHGRLLRKVDTGITGLAVSRPVLEGQVRARLLEYTNVTILEGCEVHGLATGGDPSRIVGVRLRHHSEGSTEEVLAAELVLDATRSPPTKPHLAEGTRLPPPTTGAGDRRRDLHHSPHRRYPAELGVHRTRSPWTPDREGRVWLS